MRLIVSVALGACAALLAAAAAPLLHPALTLHSDFDQLWVAARAIWFHTDPYRLIGPDSPVKWPWPLAYPPSSAVAVLPLAPLPLGLARALAVGTGVTALAWGLTRVAWWPLIILGSASALDAITAAQWSPLLTAIVLSGGLAWLAGIKPLGLALVAASFDRRAMARAALGLVLALGIATWLLPGWWTSYVPVTRAMTHVRVLATRPLGLICLLCVLRWRRREARVMIAVLAAPITPSLYETLPLLLIARTRREAMLLIAASLGALLTSAWAVPHAAMNARPDLAADLLLAWLFMPALVLLLRREREDEPAPTS